MYKTCCVLNNYQQTIREIKKIISFIIALERRKCIGIDLTKAGGKRSIHWELWDIDERSWRRHKCIGKSNIVKMSMLPQMIYRFNAILIEISVAFSQKYLEHIILKICMEPQNILNIEILSQSNTEKEEQCWVHHTFWFQTVLPSCSNHGTGIKTDIDQWNGIKSSEIDLRLYISQFMTRIYSGEGTVSLANCVRKTGPLFHTIHKS